MNRVVCLGAWLSATTELYFFSCSRKVLLSPNGHMTSWARRSYSSHLFGLWCLGEIAHPRRVGPCGRPLFRSRQPDTYSTVVAWAYRSRGGCRILCFVDGGPRIGVGNDRCLRARRRASSCGRPILCRRLSSIREPSASRDQKKTKSRKKFQRRVCAKDLPWLVCPQSGYCCYHDPRTGATGVWQGPSR